MIYNYYINYENRALELEVPSVAVSSIRKQLKGYAQGKAIHNTTRLFIFLQFLNGIYLYHVSKVELAMLTFSGHDERLNLAIQSLVSSRLMTTKKMHNPETESFFYYYYTEDLISEGTVDGENIVFQYLLPYETYLLIYCKLTGQSYRDRFAPKTDSTTPICPPTYRQLPETESAPYYQQEQATESTPEIITYRNSVFIPTDNDGKLYMKFPKKIYNSLDPETKSETINELILEARRKISHTGPAPAIISENSQDPFFATFSSWYGELKIYGYKFEHSHIGDGDGRFYHMLHSMKKKARNVNVLWDGEHITEVWDAHSSVFAAIGFYLKYHKEYNNDEEKKAYIREAQMMIGKTIHNTLYSEVQTYYIENGVQITREQAKKVTNSYRSLSYNSIFRKDGSYKTDTQYYLIDNYFKEQFPLIRDFFLSYPRRLGLRKGEKGAPIIDVDPIGFDRLISYVSVKETSNLQLHTLPYELKLISLGVCQELFYQYHIKSITVHDAIYMKNSDAKKKNIVNIIENIYMSILGWNEPNSIPRANALF